MKKILSTLMLLLWVTAGMALDQDENGYYLVSNLQELKDAVNATKDSQGKSTSKIKLTNNIYLDGMESTLCTTFAGEIDASYTVKNNSGEDVYLKHLIFSSTPGDEETRKKCSYLFSSLDGATIKNVAFYNIRVESSDRDNIGVIASMATNTTFEQVTLEKCSIFTDENNAGALAGQATSCKFYAVFVNSCSVTVDGVRAGGFVGYSENNKYCYGGSSLGTAVFADGNNATNAGWSGGIAGYSKNDRFFYMVNLALVGADQNFVGGYAGESEGSNFVRCQNSGAVLQIDEEDDDPEESFRALHEKMLEEINKKNSTTTVDAGLDKNTKLLACALNVGGNLDVRDILDLPAQRMTRVAGFIDIGLHLLNFEEVGTAVGVFEDLELGASGLLETAMAAEGVGSTGAGISMAGACAIGATVAVAVIATAIAIYIFNGDDEVGGICGKATSGLFEQCTNNATLSCRDDNCGGIVGLGKGVTINNCLNTGKIIWDEKVCSGSILGQSEANGSQKCKVTNCFSYEALHIVGNNGISAGMDPASGNNYRPRLQDAEATDWEYAIPNFGFFNKRLVGYWLNNGFENRRANVAPWRFTVNSTDQYPLLDPTHNEIIVESLGPDHISTADQLMAFATKVNNGNQFACAVLDDNIVMPAGTEWEPIGKGISGKQFRGVFDGQGHTISGLETVYSPSDVNGVGLFGTVHAGAVIRNVTVKESVFANGGFGGVAGIVGRVGIEGWRWGNVIIENCASYADVYAAKHGGGILGLVDTKTTNDPGIHVIIENCFNGGPITALSGSSGLLCGWTKHNAHIRNCWSAGQLRHYDDPSLGAVTPPYSKKPSNNDEPEYMAGYDGKIDIENCYILKSADNIDDWIADKTQDGVVDIEEAKLATGEFTYMLGGNNGHWQQNLGTDPYPVPGDKGLYHTRTVSNQYGTVCLPYPLKSDDDIKYYELKTATTTADGKVKLQFKYAETVSPGTPVVFAANGEVTFNDVNYMNPAYIPADFALSVETGEGDWKMHGHPFEKVFEGEEAKTVYYISGGNIKNAAKTTVAPYHAYFRGPSIETLTAAGAKAIQFTIEDEDGTTTALEMVGEDLVPAQHSGKAYSIMGTEVDNNYRGIVIKNGKKVIK